MSIRFPGAGLVLPYIVKTVRLFGMDISCYGILIAMGMILAMAFVILEAKRSHENPNHYLDTMILGLIFGVLGARIYYVAFYWNLYKADLKKILDIRSGGLGFYGGLLGGVLALLIVSNVCKGASFWKMADNLSLGLLAGQFIGRWGDFFNRSSFGEYTDWPVAMQLPLNAVHSSEVTGLMRENLIQIDGSSFIQVHPTFLYESVWCLLLLFILLVRRRYRLFDGEIFFRYLAGYGFGRACIEYLRTDKMLVPGTDLPVNMIVSIVLAAAGIIVLILRRGMEKKRSRYRRQRRELKYEFEERIARDEEEREIRREQKAEEAVDGEYAEAAVPEEFRQIREEDPEAAHSHEELMAELEAVVDEIEESRREVRKKKKQDVKPEKAEKQKKKKRSKRRHADTAAEDDTDIPAGKGTETDKGPDTEADGIPDENTGKDAGLNDGMAAETENTAETEITDENLGGLTAEDWAMVEADSGKFSRRREQAKEDEVTAKSDEPEEETAAVTVKEDRVRREGGRIRTVPDYVVDDVPGPEDPAGQDQDQEQKQAVPDNAVSFTFSDLLAPDSIEEDL